MQVEVVYALPTEQKLYAVRVPHHATAEQAVRLSGVLAHYPELAQQTLSLGIFSRNVSPDTALSEGDRVEIYRPLTIDPKEARMIRASKGSARSKVK